MRPSETDTMDRTDSSPHTVLRLKTLGIDSRNEHVVLMRRDCAVCLSEGFRALSRVRVSTESASIVASLVVVDGDELLGTDELALSEDAIRLLGANNGEALSLSHPGALESMGDIRRKIYGHTLDALSFDRIVSDITELKLSNVQLSAFITACAGERMNTDEIISLTRAMIDAGQKLSWGSRAVFDKHSVGGLPGNRTTPIVVAIAAAAGLIIPKTSSRAITSPAGTADVMETLTKVDLSVDEIRRVVELEGGCLAWGGAVRLSPADDILIKVERALDIDSEGQMIASVLSKKAAAGSSHVVIDVPVGATAKVRGRAAADKLAGVMAEVGEAVGLNISVQIADGSQPVGRGIGPALEAKDVLAVLRCESGAPPDLAGRAVSLAGRLLEMAGNAKRGKGGETADEILRSGKAWEKFVKICEAQGGLASPATAAFRREVRSERSGTVTAIDNRKIARVAKLAGAPASASAGILMGVRLGDQVDNGQPLFEIHAEAQGELEYSIGYLSENHDLIEIG